MNQRCSWGCRSDQSEENFSSNLFISDVHDNYDTHSDREGVSADGEYEKPTHGRPLSFRSERGVGQSPERTPWETSPLSCRSMSPFPMTPGYPFLRYKLQRNIDRPRRSTLLADCRCTATVFTEDGQISAVAATSQGVLYSASDSTKIRAWKVPEFHEFGRFKAGGGSVKAIVADGDRLYSANQDHKIRVWRLRQYPSHRRPRLLVTLPTKKDRLAKSVYPRSYVQVRRHHANLWINHVDAISALALSPRRDLLYSGSWDKTVKVWRLSDFRCLESICAHDDAVNTLMVAPSGGVLLTGSADGTVKAWVRVEDEGKHVQIALLHRHDRNCSGSVNALALCSGGAVLYAGFSDGTISCLNVTMEADAGGLGIRCRFGEPRAWRGHGRSVLCLTTTARTEEYNVVFSGSADGTIRVWKLHTCKAVLRGHASPVKCIASVDRDVDGYNSVVLYSGSLDGTIKEWRVSIHDEKGGQEDRGDDEISYSG